MRATLEQGYQSTMSAGHQSLPPYAKVGRVVAVHRDDHSLDVMFLDGNIARHVPLLSGWLGTTHGFAHMTAPTYDEELLARKTYPEPRGPVRQPPWNEGLKGRDQYVAVMQLEGSGFGSSGYVALGFFAPNVSEMLFAKEASAESPNEFSDLLLVRHPSDVQVTMEHDGKVSIQHPSGTRITIGTGTVGLEGKDYDKLYALRNNTGAYKDIEAICIGAGPEDKAHLTLRTSGIADLYGKEEINIHTRVTTHINMNDGAGKIDEFGKEEVIIYTQAGATVQVVGGDVNIEAPGTITVHAGGAVDVEGSEIRLN